MPEEDREARAGGATPLTVPGGVPNLPVGALTLDNLGSRLQDMTGDAMKARAVERFPSIMDNSTGLNPVSDLTPFGILTRIWAEVNSLIANADPADIQGPEDLPPLLLEFIDGLPFVGEFVDLLEAILGNYDGDDETLLAIQAIFAPIRAVAEAFPGLIDALINGGQPINAGNLFGLLPFDVGGGQTSLAGLFDFVPEMIVDPLLQFAETVLGGDDFDFDDTITHLNPLTGKTSNSIKVLADGNLKELYGNPMRVSEGQQVDGGIFASWAGLTGSGSPIKLFLATFQQDSPASTPVPVAEQLLGAIPFSANGSFTQILNDFIVPDGVNQVRLKLQLDDTATAGQVNFASPTLTKPLVDSLWADQLGLSGVWDVLGNIFSGTGGTGNTLGSVLSKGLLLLDAIGGQAGADIPDILQRFLHLGTDGSFSAGALSNINSIPPITQDDRIPFVGLLRSAIGGGANQGTSNDTFSVDDIFDLFQRQSNQMAQQGAAINELQTQQIADSTSGARAVEPFEYGDNDSLAETLWDVAWLAGSQAQAFIAVQDGHNAGMVRVSGSNIVEICRYNGPNNHTETGFQRSAVVVHTPMVKNSGAETHVYVWMSDDMTKWVRANYGANGQVKFEYRNGGAITQLGSTATGVPIPPVGAILPVLAGTDGGERVLEAYVGLQRVHTVTDIGGVIDITQRGGGWGQKYGTGSPGKVTQYTLGDNVPVAVTGSTIRVFRAATGGVTKGGGSGPVPANTFDTVDYISSDIVWNAATSTAKFATAGTYLFSGRFEMSNPIGFSEELYPTIVVGGAAKIRGGARRGISANAFGIPSFPQDRSAGGDAMLLYLQPNTSVQFGFFATQSNTVVGDADGGKTWFSAVKIG